GGGLDLRAAHPGRTGIRAGGEASAPAAARPIAGLALPRRGQGRRLRARQGRCSDSANLPAHLTLQTVKTHVCPTPPALAIVSKKWTRHPLWNDAPGHFHVALKNGRSLTEAAGPPNLAYFPGHHCSPTAPWRRKWPGMKLKTTESTFEIAINGRPK